MKIGDYAEMTRAFSEQDIEDYVSLGGAPMPQGILPEPLIGALFSCLLGIKLPGLGTMYMKQESDYLSAARVNETLKVRVEITRIRPDKKLVDLATTCHNEAREIICNGRALVYVGDVTSK